MTGSAGLRDGSVVVIGAGAIGSVLSYRLAQAGAKVTVIERRHTAGGATYGSFAWTNAIGKEPREYFSLNLRGMREHEVLAAELGGSWLHVDGGLVWLYRSEPGRSETGGSAGFHEGLRVMRRWGYRMESLSPEHVTRELEPDLRIDPHEVDEVFLTPLEGWVEAMPMCQAALQAASRRHGAEVVEGEVVGLRRSGLGVDGAMLADGRTVPADIIVNAAGPDAPQVASLAGVALPVRRSPGAMIVTQPLPTTLRHIVHPGGYHYWHPTHAGFRPEGGGRVMLHSAHIDSLVAAGERVDVGHPRVAQMIRDSAAILPPLRWAKAEACRIGVRAISPDEQPILGFDPLVPGLYHAVMHSGITLAAIIGRLVTDELAGQDVPEFAPFRIERFPKRQEWVASPGVVYAFERETV